MKGKEWLREEVYKLIEGYTSFGGHEHTFITGENVNKLGDLIDQLDEPEVLSQEWIDEHAQGGCDEWVYTEDLQKLLVPKKYKPVIPQFVADWLEEAKCSKVTLFGAMNESPREVDYWFIESDSTNQDLFARAWLDGYEVEKEKLYTVDLPHSYELIKLLHTQIYHIKNYSESGFGDYTNTFTEAEIKAIDERYWAFAEEVTE